MIGNFRKTDGKKYTEGVESFKNVKFPYPIVEEAPKEYMEDRTPQNRSEASYVSQIVDLQARLHFAYLNSG